eukprot:3005181-Rhodomonas_salina.1
MADTTEKPEAKPTHHKARVHWTLEKLEEAYVNLDKTEQENRLKRVLEMCGKYTPGFDFSLEKIKELATEAAADYRRILYWSKAEGEEKKELQENMKKKMCDSVIRALIIPDSDASK